MGKTGALLFTNKHVYKAEDFDSERDQPYEDDDDAKSFSSDNDYVEYENRNSMNSLMSNLYRNSPARTTPVLPNKTVTEAVPPSVNNNSGISLDKGDNSTSLVEEGLFFIDKGGDSENILNSTQQDETESVSSKTSPEIQTSTVKFEDFGGNEKCLVEVCKLLVHMRHPEVYQQLGVTPPRGFLLHGPPGCGKTLLAHAIAGRVKLSTCNTTEIVTGVSGESEEKIRDLFDKAVMSAPCIIFMDEIDSITPKRETASKDMERRIVAQLLSCLDDLNNRKDVHVLVIGATNRPDSLDPALRRAGRFDREIALGIPDEAARCRILQVLCRNLKLEDVFDFTCLARNTPGYVGADLNALTREAAMTAVNRVFNDLQKDKGDYEMTDVNNDDTSRNDIPSCEIVAMENQTVSYSVSEATEKETLSVSEKINVTCQLSVSNDHTELQSEIIPVQ
ncbi:hypothetical protein KUTeg_013718 [Tegillarca granosa]|uniref:AAA+ ATPase domain-containing protein n=1 Tax=Tegillarca granosa TaxID=220873 RepID=A0ABQ9EUI2_TEGGR|nr:hypothetical protein KUTeg_013718 [Tegillarca granosa]